MANGTTHLVSLFETADFGAETVRIGDLNGDGAPDLLYTQCVFGQRAVTCLTAVTILGETLWHWKGSTGHYPAIADVDGDGSWRLVFGNHGVHCLAVDGKELWHYQPAMFDVTSVVKAGANQLTILYERKWLNEPGTGGLMGPVVVFREK